eukprot:jgi/Bigna1/78944/fgenesh1_pg.58_\
MADVIVTAHMRPLMSVRVVSERNFVERTSDQMGHKGSKHPHGEEGKEKKSAMSSKKEQAISKARFLRKFAFRNAEARLRSLKMKKKFEENEELKNIPKVHASLLAYLKEEHSESNRLPKVSLEKFLTNEEVEEKLATDLFSIVDVNKDGSISIAEFAATLKRLASDETTSKDSNAPGQKIHAAELYMSLFDTGEGYAHQPKSLLFMLRDEIGGDFLLRHMEKELNAENFHFWRAVDTLDKDDDITQKDFEAKALSVYNRYIHKDGEEQINISSGMKKELDEAFAEFRQRSDDSKKTSGFAVRRGIFFFAKDEIFNVMNRDVFRRFKAKKRLMEEMARAYWKKMDKDENAHVDVKELNVFFEENADLLLSVDKLMSVPVSHALETESSSQQDDSAMAAHQMHQWAARAGPISGPSNV